MSGPIPPALGQLANLEYLDLERNWLSGPIPPELGQLGKLEELWLTGNQLSGPIPSELSRLANLGWLFLSSNDLSGPIPPALGQLEELRALRLNSNRFSGPIPSELADLTSLAYVDLSFNELLSGPVPAELQSLQGVSSVALLGTGVCVPEDEAFEAWSASIDYFGTSGLTCGAPVPATSVIDVAVFYTPAARRAEGGTAAIEALIDLMIAETNQAYAAGGVNQRVVLVAREEVQYTEDPRGFGSIRDLSRLADPSDRHLDVVHAIREAVDADLVHLIADRDHRDSGGGWDVCGIAFLPGGPSGAFGLTHHACGGRTFAHELGHNMGLQHDRYVTCTPHCPNWPYAHVTAT